MSLEEKHRLVQEAFEEMEALFNRLSEADIYAMTVCLLDEPKGDEGFLTEIAIKTNIEPEQTLDFLNDAREAVMKGGSSEVERRKT